MKDTDQERKSLSILDFKIFYNECQERIMKSMGIPFSGGFSQQMADKYWSPFFEQYQKDKDVDNAVDWYFSNIKPIELTDNEKRQLKTI